MDTDTDEIASLMLEESLMELMGTLFDSPDGTIPELMKYLQGDDLDVIGYSAHKLKGTALLLGFRAIAKTAGLIENLTQNGQKADAGILCEQLQRDSEATQHAMRRAIDQRTA